jgi:uncharacterized membrane protein
MSLRLSLCLDSLPCSTVDCTVDTMSECVHEAVGAILIVKKLVKGSSIASLIPSVSASAIVFSVSAFMIVFHYRANRGCEWQQESHNNWYEGSFCHAVT